MANQKLEYLVRSLRNRFVSERMKCPVCGSPSSEVVQRKALVTTLMRCPKCRLLFRAPTDPPARNQDFYQSDYECGFTTDCPNDEVLGKLVASGFKDSVKDLAPTLAVLAALGAGPGTRLLDFGASWGYATWQFREAGFNADGYEISVPRARYAREKLNVPVTDDEKTLAGPYDVFFSSHVIEHVPNPAATLALAGKLLKPGGLFVAYTPNGSLQRLAADPVSYRSHWGNLHPNFLDVEFYQHLLGSRPKLIASNPYDLEKMRSWDQKSDLVLDLRGGDIFVATVM